MEWHVIMLSNSHIEEGRLFEFLEHVKKIYESKNNPESFGLFQSHTGDEWKGYLTPVAAHHCSELIKNYSCVSCNKPHPDKDKLSWVAGDESWSIFSPFIE